MNLEFKPLGRKTAIIDGRFEPGIQASGAEKCENRRFECGTQAFGRGKYNNWLFYFGLPVFVKEKKQIIDGLSLEFKPLGRKNAIIDGLRLELKPLGRKSLIHPV